MKGVVLANEVADALPFQRFLVDSDALSTSAASAVGTDGALIDVDRPASAALRAELDRIAPAWLAGALSVRALSDAAVPGSQRSPRRWPAVRCC